MAVVDVWLELLPELRTEEGMHYQIFCRRPHRDDDTDEQILIDSNALAEGHEYFELGALDVSPSH